MDYNKIKKLNSEIAINKEKLESETDFKKKEKLRLKIKIDTLKIKMERLN